MSWWIVGLGLGLGLDNIRCDAAHPVPDSLAGPAEGQAEPAQEVAVEAAAVAALRVLSTDTNTLR